MRTSVRTPVAKRPRRQEGLQQGISGEPTMSELNDLMQEARAGSAAAQATLAAPIDCVKVSLILWQFQFHMFHPPPATTL